MNDRPRGPRIGIDAMGGDYAPRAEVAGAMKALTEEPGHYEVVLVGDRAAIESELRAHSGWESLPLRIVHAPERIEMSEAAAQAARRKKKSSLVVASGLLKDGEIDALVSAGNTGAVVATSLFTLGRLNGVDRPAIAAVIPFPATSGVVLLDVGATADCKPSHLLQFGVMGTLFARHVMGKEKPRVGLLNIGEEPTKGNELAQEAFELLTAAEGEIHFIGNVEGRDMVRGKADVVVCDGFTGNILLKTCEALVKSVKSALRREIQSTPLTMLGGLLTLPAFKRLQNSLDPDEYGGALLLGVDGVVLIAHGSSSPRAINNAVRTATMAVNQQVNAQIRRELKIAHA